MARRGFVITLVLSLVCGLCFPQTAPKTQPAKPKASASASGGASSPIAAPPDDESIPPAAPNALFPALVARVNGKPILGVDLEREVRRQLAQIMNPEWKNLREDYKGQLVYESLTSLINASLLYQKALASGIKITEAEIKDEFQRITKSFGSDAEMNAALAKEHKDRASLEKEIYQALLLSKFIAENIEKKITVTPEEVAKYYSSNPAQFHHKDLVRTSHILIHAGDTSEQDSLARQRAEALLARAKKGEDFARLAKENSVDLSASQGGDIGFAEKDQLAAEYAEAAFFLPVGGITMVKTQFGYHILKVTDKKKEGLSTLEEVRPQLTQFLKNEKIQAEVTKLVNRLRDQGKIEILIPAGKPLNP